MPIAMSNYANRQSPNQQAKIASMLNAADQSQRPDQGMPPMRMSPIDPSMGPPPIMDQSGRPDQFGGLRTYDNPPPMRSPRQDIGPAPEFEKRPYTGPGPTPAPPISQSLGRMQQQPPIIMDQGLRPDPFFGEPDTKPVPEEPSTEPSAEPTKRRRKVVVTDDTSNREPYYAPAPGMVVPSSGGGPRAPEPNREPYYAPAPGMVTLGDMGGGGTGRGFDPRVPAGPGYKTSSHLTSEEWDILRRTGYHEADGMLYSLGPDGVLFYAGNAPNREWRGEPYYGSGAGRVVPGSG